MVSVPLSTLRAMALSLALASTAVSCDPVPVEPEVPVFTDNPVQLTMNKMINALGFATLSKYYTTKYGDIKTLRFHENAQYATFDYTLDTENSTEDEIIYNSMFYYDDGEPGVPEKK